MLLRYIATYATAQLNNKTDGTPITSGTVSTYITKTPPHEQEATIDTAWHCGNGLWMVSIGSTEINSILCCVTFVHSDAVTVTSTIYTDTKIASTLNNLSQTQAQSACASAITAAGVATATNVTNAISSIKGADSDDLKTLSDQIDALNTSGSGITEKTYTITLNGSPLSGVWVGVYTDENMTNIVASGTTDSHGQVVFNLDSGTFYIKRVKAGYNFTNPDTETV